MGNMCCKREVFAPNGSDLETSHCGHHQKQQHLNNQEHHPSKQQRPTVMSSAYPGDDCAINELLEGRMDLDVLLPDGRQVRLTVERRTPMMDLLVQAASATKISPGGHVIHVFGDGDKSSGTLPYKPSTPIGSLDANTIYIVPKKEAGDPYTRRMGKTANRPFEPTFRVQVHLPRNQLTVLRVSPRIHIAELKAMVCNEKGLDTSRYQLVRPSGPTQPLSGNMTLAEYGSTEITLLSNSSIESHIGNSRLHIIPYSKRQEEQKRKTGILRLLTEDNQHKNSNPISSNRVDACQRNGNSKSNDIHQPRCKPKKRRPAPQPPSPILQEAIVHSRQSSSDSSGYHEATSSFLHEEHSGEEKASSDSSGVSSLDAKVTSAQQATVVQQPSVQNLKKKKAPAPPPPLALKAKQIEKETILSDNPVVESVLTQEDSVTNKNNTLHEISVPLKDPLENINVETEIIPKLPDTDTKEDFITNKGSNFPKKSELLKDHLENISDQIESISKLPYISLQKDSETSSNVDERQNEAERNLLVKTDSFSKLDFVGKDLIIHKDYALKDSTTFQKTNNVSTNLIIQDELTNPITEKNPKLSDDLINSKSFSTLQNNSPPHETIETLNNDLNLKDHVTEKNSLIRNNPNPPKDHVILKDPLSMEDENSKKKLDVGPVCDQKLQSQMTAIGKESPTGKISKDPLEEKTKICKKLPDTRKRPEAITNFVLDTYESRTADKKVEKYKSSEKSESVSTKVALVALNARIEQNVTQQEIASNIQAAFHSLDRSSQRPSLLAIKQRKSDDILTNSIPSPENPFKAIGSEHQKTTVVSNSELDDSVIKQPSKYDISDKEALLIDEEPPPRPLSANSVPASNLKRSSSLLNFAETTSRNVSSKSTKRVRNLQRSLSDLSAEDKEDFEVEQERLQQEYIKLQRQFMLWQQQLMNNHAMLREECLLPQYARTLSLPEGEDYSDTKTPSVPLVSRSLSYEPAKERCSTLPRSTINIPSLEFGSIHINNGTTTLRSSKTKSYFKPPQVRISTKSRQRIPPEIKKEGDVDITDDTKMLTTILPSFESLKLITENCEEDMQLSVSRLKDTISTTKLTLPQEGKKIPVVHQFSTFPKLNSKLNNSEKIVNRDLKSVNGDTGLSNLPVEALKMNEKALVSQHLPPPPPMPVGGVPKSIGKENYTLPPRQQNSVSKKSFTPAVDPREQLMLEIRKFGGRTALRKISLAS